MAVTTEISWGDGTSDKIYLTRNASEGNQTVLVSSDANTGAARSKVVTFSASGVTPVTLTVSQAGVPVSNYLIVGSPTINGNIMIPDTSARGFIYTNKAFDPGTKGWVIQTKMKLKTAIAWRDIIASVDSDGASKYSIVVEFNTGNNNQRYTMYLSGNGTSWNIANNSTPGTFPLNEWMVFQFVCTRSGSNYVYKMGFPETPSWTSNLSKTSHPLYGRHIAFGGGFAGTSPDCEIDLSETKIWIDGDLWWEAVSSSK